MRYLALIIVVVVAGCLVAPTDPMDIESYNTKLIALWTPVVSALIPVLGFVALWIKSNIDRKKTATETTKVADDLAASTADAREKVLVKIQETHKANTEAIDKANHTNDKILKIAEQQAELTAKMSHPDPDTVIKAEIAGAPGITTPLQVVVVEPTHQPAPLTATPTAKRTGKPKKRAKK